MASHYIWSEQKVTPTTPANPLRAYLDRNGLDIAAFATQIGETYATTRRHTLPLDDPEFVVPKPERMSKIVAATNGEVQPNGFFGLPPSADAAVGAAEAS